MEKIKNVAQIWENLERCTDRGLSFYNERTRTFDYFSYADMYNKAGRAAAVLRKKGIKTGDMVLVNAGTSWKLPVLWLAILWQGGTPVPMPPRDNLLGDNSFQNRIADIVPHYSYYITIESEREIIATAAPGIKIITFAEIFDTTSDRELPDRNTPSNGDTAFVQYTSGSTGSPKGILVTYTNLLANINGMWSRLEVDIKTTRAASWLPLYHDMGLVGYLLGCLFSQTSLMLLSPVQFAKRPLYFFTVITEYSIENCCMPNFALELILKRYKPEKSYDFSLSTLNWIGVGAEPINTATLDRFIKAFEKYGLRRGVVSPCYGLAEATLGVTISKPFTPHKIYTLNENQFTTTGSSLENMEIRIDSPDPAGIGAIKIKGDSVVTHAFFDGVKKPLLGVDGFYNTRDMGCFLDGELVVMGRYDEMFIVNGENYFPYDIENIIRDSGILKRNRVICFAPTGRSSDKETKIVVLYETKQTGPVAEEVETKIKRLIKHSLGLDIHLVKGVSAKSIPVTTSGKLKRKQARTLFIERIL